jgi:hypothetical protein
MVFGRFFVAARDGTMPGKMIFYRPLHKAGTKLLTARFFAVPPMKREAAIKTGCP